MRCLCQYLEGLEPLDNRTEVIILQHPRERLHPLGTAQLVRLGLRRTRLEVALDRHRDLHKELALPPDAGLLSPGRGAVALEDVPAERQPAALVLLDGTWKHARKLLQRNPWLERLPRYKLTPREPERYRIRGEPDEASRSTVEAAALALRLLEPELGPGLDRLLEAFDRMIEEQVQIISRQQGTGGRRRRHFPPPDPLHRRLPAELPRLVLVYVEAAGADMLQIAATRPDTGAHLELMLRPEGPALEPWRLERMQLSPDALDGAPAPEQALARWREFAGPEPLLAAWNQRTLDLMRTFDPTLLPANERLLKAAYCNLGRGGGALPEVVVREGLTPAPFPARGRAGERVAAALAVLEWLLTAPK